MIKKMVNYLLFLRLCFLTSELGIIVSTSHDWNSMRIFEKPLQFSQNKVNIQFLNTHSFWTSTVPFFHIEYLSLFQSKLY